MFNVKNAKVRAMYTMHSMAVILEAEGVMILTRWMFALVVRVLVYQAYAMNAKKKNAGQDIFIILHIKEKIMGEQ